MCSCNPSARTLLLLKVLQEGALQAAISMYEWPLEAQLGPHACLSLCSLLTQHSTPYCYC